VPMCRAGADSFPERSGSNESGNFLFSEARHSLVSKGRWYVGRCPNGSDCADLEMS
jgi:hypothetical protein